MPDIADDKLPLTTPDLTAGLLAHLHEVAPQVFCEGKVDFDKLKAALGATLEERTERYGLSWAGKSEAFRNVQIPSVATLLPQPAESVAWDTTENQIIEGDNLEVLKLLQKSYHGKIKMIYIDPPYNTGNEFIYPDNYREGLKDYLRYSGQVSEEGIKQSTNTETGGRFHSNWLSMMYPRLFLARNLLREDGVIFVSIDDNEVHNLRMLMNEVFGEENFVAQLVWKSRLSEDTRAKTGVSTDHEYVVCYARSESVSLRGVDKDLTKFSNPDNDPRGSWRSADMTGLAIKEQRPNLHYDLINPVTGINYGCPQRGWRFEPKVMSKKIAEARVLFPESCEGRPRHKLFLSEMKSRYKNISSIVTAVTTAEGTRECTEFIGMGLFQFPKPSGLIKILMQQVTAEDDIILDFFAGSGTTAHAVLELNQEDDGNRKFILVQLPEKTDNPQFPTIADITRERVRRVIDKLKNEGQIPPGLPLSKGGNKSKFENKTENKSESLFAQPEAFASLPPLAKGGGGDLGFRAFKLSSSNFKIWDADAAPTEPAALAVQLKLYADNVEAARDQQDILFELILKTGHPLSSRIVSIDVAGGTAYSIDDGKLLVCLENPVNRDMLRAMTALKPTQMLCLDIAFHGDDALKTNTVLETRAHGVVFRTV